MRVVPVPPDAGEVFVAKQCVHCGKILPGEKKTLLSWLWKSSRSTSPVKKIYIPGTTCVDEAT